MDLNASHPSGALVDISQTYKVGQFDGDWFDVDTLANAELVLDELDGLPVVIVTSTRTYVKHEDIEAYYSAQKEQAEENAKKQDEEEITHTITEEGNGQSPEIP